MQALTAQRPSENLCNLTCSAKTFGMSTSNQRWAVSYENNAKPFVSASDTSSDTGLIVGPGGLLARFPQTGKIMYRTFLIICHLCMCYVTCINIAELCMITGLQSGLVHIHLYKAKVFGPVEGSEWHLSDANDASVSDVIVKRGRFAKTTTFATKDGAQLTNLTHKRLSKHSEFSWSSKTYRWSNTCCIHFCNSCCTCVLQPAI